jgi:quercetin dioxygenase-like cupin family protein
MIRLLLALCLIAPAFLETRAEPRAETPAETLPDPLAAGWEGKPVCEKLHEDDKLRVLRCTFPPGVGHEKHFHPRHVGYVIEGGRMRITDASGTREQDVPTGISFSNPEGIPWHEAVNIGASTASYLMIEPK